MILGIGYLIKEVPGLKELLGYIQFLHALLDHLELIVGIQDSEVLVVAYKVSMPSHDPGKDGVESTAPDILGLIAY